MLSSPGAHARTARPGLDAITDGSCSAIDALPTCVPGSTLTVPRRMAAERGLRTNIPLICIVAGKMQRYHFTLSEEPAFLSWDAPHSRKSATKILGTQLIGVKRGQTTEIFAKLPDAKSFKSVSFSIFYKDRHWRDTQGNAIEQSLNLIAESEEECALFTCTVETMISHSTAILGYMHKGATMTKIRPKDQYRRRFFLTDDNQYISWEPSKEANPRLPLASVKFIRLGQSTAAFRKARNVAQYDRLSFSLIYGDQFETLDLIAHRPDDYERWVEGLQALVAGAADSQAMMQRGTRMAKVRGGGRPPLMRTFTLSPELDRITWTPKTRGHDSIAIASIKELRKGHRTEVFHSLRDSSDTPEEQCFSLIYGDDYKTLDLFVPAYADFFDWIVGLEDLLYDIHEPRRNMALPTRDDMVALFNDYAERTGRKAMTARDACQVLFAFDGNLNTEGNVKAVRKFFSKNGYTSISALQFATLSSSLSLRPDLYAIMAPHATADDAGSLTMTAAQLQSFLVRDQKMDPATATIEYCASLINELESGLRVTSPTISPRPGRRGMERQSSVSYQCSLPAVKTMTIAGFTALLLSLQGDAFDPAHDAVYQDMSQPLNHYYVSSSHNTYLMEDQLKASGSAAAGPSSVEAYVQAILKGCRCIEIDCWDGPQGEPVIYHGHTLTSKIAFRDVITTINEYAFKESNYPLIISVENHCSLVQQKFMAAFMKSIFAEKLVPPIEDTITQLPSPEQLKILIKCHKPVGTGFAKVVVSIDDDGVKDNGQRSAALMRRASVRKLQTASRRMSLAQLEGMDGMDLANEDVLLDLQEDELDDAGDGDLDGADECGKEKKSKSKNEIRLHQDFSDLIVYTASVPRFAKRMFQCWFMSSFGESQGQRFASSPLLSIAFVEYNKSFNSRIFPAATRVDSSNYLPQMVALNFQTEGTAMQLNKNGNCGYVLKPRVLRDPTLTFTPHTVRGLVSPGSTPIIFSIRVISAQNLPRALVISPSVTLEVIGVPADGWWQKTATSSKGQSPNWNEAFHFPVAVPELAIVRLLVRDHRGHLRVPGFLGEATVPLDSLREGYRHIRLNAWNGEPLTATLFLHISKTEGLRSKAWFSQLARPPLAVKQGQEEELTLVNINLPELDAKKVEIQAFLRKAAQACEKALWSRDKRQLEESKHSLRRTRAGQDPRRASMEQSLDDALDSCDGHAAALLPIFAQANEYLAVYNSAAANEPLSRILQLVASPTPCNEHKRLAFMHNSTRLHSLIATLRMLLIAPIVSAVSARPSLALPIVDEEIESSPASPLPPSPVPEHQYEREPFPVMHSRRTSLTPAPAGSTFEPVQSLGDRHSPVSRRPPSALSNDSHLY